MAALRGHDLLASTGKSHQSRLILDWRVLGFCAAAAIAAALAFGLAPALRGSRTAPQDGLRAGGRGATGARSYWFQHSLIVIETALAVTLLTSGGLLLETFRRLRNTNLGIQREKLVTFETPVSAMGTSDAAMPSSAPSWKRYARFPV